MPRCLQSIPTSITQYQRSIPWKALALITPALLLFVARTFEELRLLSNGVIASEFNSSFLLPLFKEEEHKSEHDQHHSQNVFLREIDIRYRSRNATFSSTVGTSPGLLWPLIEDYEFRYPIFNLSFPNFFGPGAFLQ